MDCLEFRRHHLAYVDDTLPGDVLVAVERHRVECAECGAHDTLVRRSLLLARNLPTVELSDDFAARLEARLRGEGFGGGRPALADTRPTSTLHTRAFSGRLTRDAAGEYAGAWYTRLARDSGGWGRQAAAAAVLFAAASAGYAVRGGREGAGEAATTPAATAAPMFGVPAFGAASLGSSAGAASAESSAAGAATEVAAGVAAAGTAVTSAARSARAPHAPRRRGADHAAGDPADAFDADGLGTPAYIPLPAGALETSALLGPATAGVPVWPAALLAGEAPVQLRTVVPGAPAVRVVGLSH